MKKLASFIVLPLTLFSYPAAAQMAVFDSANVKQSINQVEAWKRQYQQMIQQQQQLQYQYGALTGSRGLGLIANNPQLRTIVPDSAATTFDAMRSNGGKSMTPAAQAIRAATRLYDCQNFSGQNRTTCQAVLNTAAQTQAFQQNALAGLSGRIAQLQILQSQINTTTDPKAIGELQARIQVEAAQVSNDTNRLLIMNAMAESAHRSNQQALKEQELRNLSLASDGTDTFVYKPYSAK